VAGPVSRMKMRNAGLVSHLNWKSERQTQKDIGSRYPTDFLGMISGYADMQISGYALDFQIGYPILIQIQISTYP
jgi:hypothetical protein